MDRIKSEIYYLNLFYGFVLAALFIVFSYVKFSFYQVCFPCVIIFFIIDMFLFRSKQTILFLNFYIFIYFLYLYFYFYRGSTLSTYVIYNKRYLFERACLLFYIYYFSEYCVFSKIKSKKGIDVLIRDKKIHFPNIVIYILIFMSFVLLLLTFRIGVDMIRTGFNYQVYIQNLKSSSVIPMLFIVVFSIYAFSSKSNKLVCFFFAIAYTYFCISRGFRITAIPGMMVLFVAFYEGKIGNRIFFAVLILGILGILLMGVVKDTGSLNLSSLFNNDAGDGVIISHHSDILYTVTSMFGLIEDQIIDGVQRIELGISFFLQGVILPSFFPSNLRYPLVLMMNTPNGGGGLFLAGCYLFWGYLGVFLFSYYINKLIMTSYSTNSELKRLLVGVIFVFCCNWVSYDFHTILRFPFYAFVLYWLFKHFDWRKLVNEKSIGS